ncbi:protocatechuate 3,4-dioxygenase [uncultured Ramlibacter sp.]|uniref:protocatechuate 3,4-dioxygenase n=1 Tax=uncultured Ramlibacter sp. TaxID=260755 RepID=UPI002621ED87|nr:protocatechuate 3,4-dioxygenase [uncultured Ramlibacter sp.]
MSPAPPLLPRRTVTAALVVAPALWLGARAQPEPVRRPTPGQTEGPFYPVQLPKDSDHDLLRNGTARYSRGQPAWVSGQVSDLQGRPLAGAQVEIWQCDEAGHYHHPGDGGKADPAFQGFGRVRVGADGQWRFRTIRPVAYGGRTPHIHFKVRLDQRELLTTQLYVQGDPHNARDFLWRNLDAQARDAITVAFQPGSDGLQAVFPIAVAA